jgi:hypothetical protein
MDLQNLLGKSTRCAIVFVLFMIAGADFVRAEDDGGTADSSSAGEQWRFGFAPYLWTTGLSGNVAAFGAPTVRVDASAEDLLSDLDMALMGVGVVEHGRWGVFADIVYSDVSTDSKNTPGPLFGSASLDAETFFITPMLQYQVVDNGWAELYPMAGVRVWYSQSTFNFSSGLLNGRSFSDDATWVDPTIGLRGRLMLDKGLWLDAWGIVGGFDVDHDQFMWDVLGTISYDVADWASLVAGYRATGTDYSDGGYVFDVTMQGPIFGAVFRF